FLLLLIFVAGLAARALTFGGEAFFENDYFRYLWDGAVVANFHSPFGYAPESVIDPQIVNSTKISSLIVIAQDATGVIENINYPFLSTVYPFVAQAFFAISYVVEPFSLNAWRAVLVCADIVNFLLILTLLRMVNRSLLWAAIYWLNPLVIGEFFNSAHVDLLIFPFLLMAFIAAVKRWPHCSVFLLALATAVKVWPILLLPLFLRPYVFRNLRKTIGLVLTFSITCLVLFLPLILELLSENVGTGLAAYSQFWTMNQSFYKLVFAFSDIVVSAFNPINFAAAEDNTHRLARLIIALAVGSVAVLVALKPWETTDQLITRTLIIVAFMFALSPTQFPWYYCWLVPLLAIRPVNWLLILTATMPLYYTRFAFVEEGSPGIYDTYVVWFIWAPVILLFFRDFLSLSQKRLSQLRTYLSQLRA
ncbi:MAG: hypothetical protein ACPGVN_05130, partial [Alphaproteobacteria bacterium]